MFLGGAYGGAEVLKSRLLPWLGQGLLASTGYNNDRTLGILAESAAKDREINHVSDMYERSLQELDGELQVTQAEAQDLKQQWVVLTDWALWDMAIISEMSSTNTYYKFMSTSYEIALMWMPRMISQQWFR